MKFLKNFGIALGLMLLAFTAPAQLLQSPWYPSGGLTAVSVGTTNGNTALSWAIVPAKSANNGTPYVTYLNASSDLAFNQGVYAYQITTNTTANFVSTTTSVPVAQTNGFTVNDVIIIRHLADENYEKRVVTTFTSGTNLTLTVAPMEALAIGDLVYRCQTNAGPNIAMTTSNVTLIGSISGPIFSGQKGMPLLIEVNATTKGAVNAVTAVYQ